jgi:putative redox protein
VEVGASFHRSAQGERDSLERTPVLEGELNAQQRAFLLEAANLCPVGVILGITADIHTRPDATASGHNASTQASYEDDLAELQVPNIDPD